MYGLMLFRYIYMIETEIHGEMSCFYGKCSPDVEQALNLTSAEIPWIGMHGSAVDDILDFLKISKIVCFQPSFSKF